MDFRTSISSSAADATTAQAANDRMNAILARSATDRAFRQKLVANPREALADFKGVSADELPQDLHIQFVESNGVPTVVLPAYVSEDGQLSEAELETVSGGSTTVCFVIIGYLLAN